MNQIDTFLSELEEIKDGGDNITETQLRKSIERINKRKRLLSERKLELILTECTASDKKIFYLEHL